MSLFGAWGANQAPSAAKAGSRCSAVNASLNGRLSACNSESRTSSNALDTTEQDVGKEMRPSLVSSAHSPKEGLTEGEL